MFFAGILLRIQKNLDLGSEGEIKNEYSMNRMNLQMIQKM